MGGAHELRLHDAVLLREHRRVDLGARLADRLPHRRPPRDRGRDRRGRPAGAARDDVRRALGRRRRVRRAVPRHLGDRAGRPRRLQAHGRARRLRRRDGDVRPGRRRDAAHPRGPEDAAGDGRAAHGRRSPREAGRGCDYRVVAAPAPRSSAAPTVAIVARLRGDLHRLGLDVPRHPLGGGDDPAVRDDVAALPRRRGDPAGGRTVPRARLQLAGGARMGRRRDRRDALLRRLATASSRMSRRACRRRSPRSAWPRCRSSSPC